MSGAMAWRTLITRYVPNTAPRVQSLMSTILVVKTLPSAFTAYEIALDDWEGIRKWESVSGDRCNVSMKKALFLDKAHSSVRVPLQMQNLDTFEAMAAVSLQFPQHDAQFQAGVTVTPNNRRTRRHGDRCLDEERQKVTRARGRAKTDGQKTSCVVCRRVAHVVIDSWLKETRKGSVPNNKGKKRPLHPWEPQPVKS